MRAAKSTLGQIKNPFELPQWLPELKDRDILRKDLIAGLTVALVLIPQSMAYAQLAGLPAHYGLYASLLPPVIAAFFGSSRQLATGPVAMVSLMTAASLEPLATAGSEAFVGYAILLAFMVGLFQLVPQGAAPPQPQQPQAPTQYQQPQQPQQPQTPGYPAQPDHTEKRVLFDLLDVGVFRVHQRQGARNHYHGWHRFFLQSKTASQSLRLCVRRVCRVASIRQLVHLVAGQVSYPGRGRGLLPGPPECRRAVSQAPQTGYSSFQYHHARG